MPEYEFETVNVFTQDRFGGNPLAVVTGADGLDAAQMQAIAREFNLSETTFVLAPRDAGSTAAVRIFTPVTELPFAGHPNVGTALVLAWRAERRPSTFLFEEAAGPVAIRFDWEGDGVGSGRATLTAPQPLQVEGEVDAAVAAAACGLGAEAVVQATHAPCIAGVGTPFVLMEVTAAAREAASPDLGAMRAAAARYRVRPIGFPVLLYSREGDAVRARMFSPLSGINEDPATGSAVAALAALLASVGGGERRDIVVYQGVEMGRPSVLHASGYRSGGAVLASVGGGAVPVMRGRVKI